MSEAYLMSMPVIINCLGGEMIYILCSRLKAQSISQEKSIRVIKDIGNLLYNKKFQNDLYIHKKPNKHQEVKSIFESLAHSSIMRLNSTSMNKLFELMLMTLKLQILRTRYPEEIYQVTLNHFICVMEIMKMIDPNDNLLINLVADSMDNFLNIYGKLTPYDYIILKSVILRFLQGKNVKVSIFIQENLQDSNSVIYLPMNEVSPPYVEQVGTVKNRIKDTQEYSELKLSKFYSENKNEDRMDNFETDFGKNMFTSNSFNFVGREKKTINEHKIIEDKVKTSPKIENDFNINKVYEAAPIPLLVENSDSNIDKNINKENKLYKESEDRNKKIHEQNKETKKNDFKTVNEIKDSVLVGNYYEHKELSEQQKKIISQGNKNDLNLFSSVFAENGNNNDDFFEFDLFGGNEKKQEKQYKEDFIDIKNKNNNLKSKMNEKFGNLGKNEDDIDDLLDLMDKNV